ncbi:MAG: amidohydrolase, partial [Thermoguttaceae bacterium]
MKRREFLGISIPLVSAAVLAEDAYALSYHPQTAVFYNGKIVTADSEFKIAEAFFVEGNRIQAVGTTEEMLERAKKFPQTKKHDLKGRFVMPGIIDSHAHPVAAAMYELDHEIPYMETLADVLEYFKSRAKVVPKGEWIGLQQVFITRLKDKRYPTREELDSAVSEHPAFMRTGPDAMLNSLALAKFGVTKDSGNHEGSGLGKIERDPVTNEPTGMMRNCTAVGSFLIPDTQGAGYEKQIEQLRKLFTAYNKVGITTIADRNATDEDIKLYQTMSMEGSLSCRVQIYHEVNAKLTPDEIEAKVRSVQQGPFSRSNDMFRIGGVKMFLDGGMLTGSARMRQPWGESPIYKITDPEYKGLLLISDEQLVRFLKAAAENKLQPALHCVGDGALETLISAIEKAENELPAGSLQAVRPDICHGNFMYPEAIDAIKRIGAVVDMQPAWLYLDGA